MAQNADSPDQKKRTGNKPDGTLMCEILRDFWDDEGKRHRAGKEVELPVEAAIEGIESGALKRIKD